MKIQINRKHYIELDNIEKLVIKNGNLLVYRKIGYPNAYKASCGIIEFKMRIANAKGDFTNIPIIKEQS